MKIKYSYYSHNYPPLFDNDYLHHTPSVKVSGETDDPMILLRQLSENSMLRDSMGRVESYITEIQIKELSDEKV